MVTSNRAQLIRVAAAVWVVAAVVYLVVEKIAAANVKGHYSYLHHYISVLGVPAWGRFAWLMNGAFYLQGALTLVGAILVIRASGRRGVFFGFFTAAASIGYFLVATVHGGSPLAEGQGMQLHMIGALLVFIAGNLAIVFGSKVVARAVDAPWWYRAVSLVFAAAGLIAWLMLANYNVWTYRYAPVGIVERVPVYSILAWQLFSAAVLSGLLCKRRVHVEHAGV
ncbi:DUF998 domain-containing protein [Mycobacterium sp. NPDC048908]|uniref:DUF998 domain-containing protein n=1 Tax=Mycobacterium sp. NPDC048908 TaxID=3364292 RepID=UPI0037156BDE